MSSALIDRDPPDDENAAPHHEVTPESGLCANTWCDDAALPGEEYCKECLIEILAMEAELGF